jgi:hypothetical protein
MTRPLPRIALMARAGEPLSSLQAVAGKLWLGYGGDQLDEDGAIARAIGAFWAAEGDGDPYWDYLDNRFACDGCGESYKLENLAVCPNCFALRCHKHDRACSCGHTLLG